MSAPLASPARSSLVLGTCLLGLALAPARARAEVGGPDQNDRFGAALAADGAQVAVGAPGDNAAGFDAGSVFLYRLDGERWSLEDRLSPIEPRAREGFGARVALAGATLVVGTAPPDGRGSAYVFHRSAGGWLQAARLTLDADDHAFASGVYAAGPWIGVFAAFAARGTAWSPAELHLYRRTGDGYAARQVLHGVSADGFLLAEDLLLLADADGVAVHEPVGGAWTRTATLRAGAAGLTSELAYDGTTVWALGHDAKAYAFVRAGDGWSKGQVQPLPADEGTFDFGPVAVSGDWAVVRERRIDGADDVRARVHAFARVGDDWQRRPALASAAANDDFAAAIAASGDWLWIGAPQHGEDREGAAWVYRRGEEGRWGLYQGLTPERLGQGCAVAPTTRGGPLALVLLLGLRRRRR